MDIALFQWVAGIVFAIAVSIAGWYFNSINDKITKHNERLEMLNVGIALVHGKLDTIIAIMSTKQDISELDKHLSREINDTRERIIKLESYIK